MWRIAAFLGVFAGAAGAQTVEDVADAVQGWLTEQDARGVIAIQPPGMSVEVVNLGLPVDQPVGLASLSKAITAVCMSQLVEETRLNWTDPVSDHVAGFDDVLVHELITHTGGITQDATQTYMSVWLDDPQHRATEIVEFMRKREAPTGERGIYAYSNDNYALAAEVIEAASGQTYEDACRARALAPADVEGMPSEHSGAFLSWGGWAMTVEDYLKFHAHWFDTQTKDLSGPAARFGGGAVYGLGMLSRPMQGGRNYWHFGGLCFPNRLNLGSYAVAFFNDWRLVVAYDVCVEWSAMAALDGVIARAIFAPD